MEIGAQSCWRHSEGSVLYAAVHPLRGVGTGAGVFIHLSLPHWLRHRKPSSKLQVAPEEDRGSISRSLTAPAARSMTRNYCKHCKSLLIVLNSMEDGAKSMCTHR